KQFSGGGARFLEIVWHRRRKRYSKPSLVNSVEETGRPGDRGTPTRWLFVSLSPLLLVSQSFVNSTTPQRILSYDTLLAPLVWLGNPFGPLFLPDVEE